MCKPGVDPISEPHESQQKVYDMTLPTTSHKGTTG